MGGQEPAATALFEGVQAIACGGLRDLADDHLYEPLEQGREYVALRHFRSEGFGADAKRRTGNLDDAFEDRVLNPEQSIRTGDAFGSDRSNLDGPTVSHGLDQRNEAPSNEI